MASVMSMDFNNKVVIVTGEYTLGQGKPLSIIFICVIHYHLNKFCQCFMQPYYYKKNQVPNWSLGIHSSPEEVHIDFIQFSW